MKILTILFVIALIRTFINFARLQATKHYFKKYRDCISSFEYKSGLSDEMLKYAQPIAILFNKAGTNHISVLTEGHASRHAPVSDCIGSRRHTEEVKNTFYKTIGIYELRIRQTINPVYWLEFPLRIIENLQLETSKITNTLLTVLSWGLSAVAGYYVEKFLDSQRFRDVVDAVYNTLK